MVDPNDSYLSDNSNYDYVPANGNFMPENNGIDFTNSGITSKAFNKITGKYYDPNNIKDPNHPGYIPPALTDQQKQDRFAAFDELAQMNQTFNEYEKRKQNDGWLKNYGASDEEIKNNDPWGRDTGEILKGPTDYDKDLAENQRLGVAEHRDGLMEESRYNAQGWIEKLGNAVDRTVMGAAYQFAGGLGGMLDFEDYYNQNNEVGNWLSEWSNKKLEETQEANPIYTSEKTSDWLSPTAWLKHGSDLASSMAAFYALGMLGGAIASPISKIKDLAKLTNAVKRGKQLDGTPFSENMFGKMLDGKTISAINKGTDIASVGANAAMMNQAEGIMSAGEVFNDVYKDALARGYSDDYAKQAAAQSAATTVSANKTNMLFNFYQANNMMKAAGQIDRKIDIDPSKWASLKRWSGEMLSEAGEEAVTSVAEDIGKKAGQNILDRQLLTGTELPASNGIQSGDAIGIGSNAVQQMLGRPIIDALTGAKDLLTGNQYVSKHDVYNAVDTDKLLESAVLGALGGGGQKVLSDNVIGNLGNSDSKISNALNYITGGNLSDKLGVNNWFGNKQAEKYNDDVYAFDSEGNAVAQLNRKDENKYEQEDVTFENDEDYEEGDVLKETVRVPKMDDNGQTIPNEYIDLSVGTVLNEEQTKALSKADVKKNRKGDIKYQTDEFGQDLYTEELYKKEVDDQGNLKSVNKRKIAEAEKQEALQEVTSFQKELDAANKDLEKVKAAKQPETDATLKVKELSDSLQKANNKLAIANQKLKEDDDLRKSKRLKQTKDKLDERGNKIQMFKKDASGKNITFSNNKQADVDRQEAIKLKELYKTQVETQAKLANTRLFTNTADNAVAALEALGGTEMKDEVRTRLTRDAAERIALIRLSGTANASSITKEQIKQEADKIIANELSIEKSSDIRNRNNLIKELSQVSLDRQTLHTIEEGNVETLIQLWKDLSNITPDQAKAKGLSDNYKEIAEKNIARIKELNNLWIEYSTKTNYPEQARALFMNRLQYDRLRNEALDIEKEIAEKRKVLSDSLAKLSNANANGNGDTANMTIEAITNELALLESKRRTALDNIKFNNIDLDLKNGSYEDAKKAIEKKYEADVTKNAERLNEANKKIRETLKADIVESDTLLNDFNNLQKKHQALNIELGFAQDPATNTEKVPVRTFDEISKELSDVSSAMYNIKKKREPLVKSINEKIKTRLAEENTAIAMETAKLIDEKNERLKDLAEYIDNEKKNINKEYDDKINELLKTRKSQSDDDIKYPGKADKFFLQSLSNSVVKDALKANAKALSEMTNSKDSLFEQAVELDKQFDLLRQGKTVVAELNKLDYTKRMLRFKSRIINEKHKSLVTSFHDIIESTIDLIIEKGTYNDKQAFSNFGDIYSTDTKAAIKQAILNAQQGKATLSPTQLETFKRYVDKLQLPMVMYRGEKWVEVKTDVINPITNKSEESITYRKEQYVHKGYYFVRIVNGVQVGYFNSLPEFPKLISENEVESHKNIARPGKEKELSEAIDAIQNLEQEKKTIWSKYDAVNKEINALNTKQNLSTDEEARKQSLIEESGRILDRNKAIETQLKNAQIKKNKSSFYNILYPSDTLSTPYSGYHMVMPYYESDSKTLSTQGITVNISSFDKELVKENGRAFYKSTNVAVETTSATISNDEALTLFQFKINGNAIIFGEITDESIANEKLSSLKEGAVKKQEFYTKNGAIIREALNDISSYETQLKTETDKVKIKELNDAILQKKNVIIKLVPKAGQESDGVNNFAELMAIYIKESNDEQAAKNLIAAFNFQYDKVSKSTVKHTSGIVKKDGITYEPTFIDGITGTEELSTQSKKNRIRYVLNTLFSNPAALPAKTAIINALKGIPNTSIEFQNIVTNLEKGTLLLFKPATEANSKAHNDALNFLIDSIGFSQMESDKYTSALYTAKNNTPDSLKVITGSVNGEEYSVDRIPNNAEGIKLIDAKSVEINKLFEELSKFEINTLKDAKVFNMKQRIENMMHDREVRAKKQFEDLTNSQQTEFNLYNEYVNKIKEFSDEEDKLKQNFQFRQNLFDSLLNTNLSASDLESQLIIAGIPSENVQEAKELISNVMKMREESLRFDEETQIMYNNIMDSHENYAETKEKISNIKSNLKKNQDLVNKHETELEELSQEIFKSLKQSNPLTSIKDIEERIELLKKNALFLKKVSSSKKERRKLKTINEKIEVLQNALDRLLIIHQEKQSIIDSLNNDITVTTEELNVYNNKIEKLWNTINFFNSNVNSFKDFELKKELDVVNQTIRTNENIITDITQLQSLLTQSLEMITDDNEGIVKVISLLATNYGVDIQFETDENGNIIVDESNNPTAELVDTLYNVLEKMGTSMSLDSVSIAMIYELTESLKHTDKTGFSTGLKEILTAAQEESSKVINSVKEVNVELLSKAQLLKPLLELSTKRYLERKTNNKSELSKISSDLDKYLVNTNQLAQEYTYAKVKARKDELKDLVASHQREIDKITEKYNERQTKLDYLENILEEIQTVYNETNSSSDINDLDALFEKNFLNNVLGELLRNNNEITTLNLQKQELNERLSELIEKANLDNEETGWSANDQKAYNTAMYKVAKCLRSLNLHNKGKLNYKDINAFLDLSDEELKKTGNSVEYKKVQAQVKTLQNKKNNFFKGISKLNNHFNNAFEKTETVKETDKTKKKKGQSIIEQFNKLYSIAVSKESTLSPQELSQLQQLKFILERTEKAAGFSKKISATRTAITRNQLELEEGNTELTTDNFYKNRKNIQSVLAKYFDLSDKRIVEELMSNQKGTELLNKYKLAVSLTEEGNSLIGYFNSLSKASDLSKDEHFKIYQKLVKKIDALKAEFGDSQELNDIIDVIDIDSIKFALDSFDGAFKDEYLDHITNVYQGLTNYNYDSLFDIFNIVDNYERDILTQLTKSVREMYLTKSKTESFDKEDITDETEFDEETQTRVIKVLTDLAEKAKPDDNLMSLGNLSVDVLKVIKSKQNGKTVSEEITVDTNLTSILTQLFKAVDNQLATQQRIAENEEKTLKLQKQLDTLNKVIKTKETAFRNHKDFMMFSLYPELIGQMKQYSSDYQQFKKAKEKIDSLQNKLNDLQNDLITYEETNSMGLAELNYDNSTEKETRKKSYNKFVADFDKSESALTNIAIQIFNTSPNKLDFKTIDDVKSFFDTLGSTDRVSTIGLILRDFEQYLSETTDTDTAIQKAKELVDSLLKYSVALGKINQGKITFPYLRELTGDKYKQAFNARTEILNVISQLVAPKNGATVNYLDNDLTNFTEKLALKNNLYKEIFEIKREINDVNFALNSLKWYPGNAFAKKAFKALDKLNDNKAQLVSEKEKLREMRRELKLSQTELAANEARKKEKESDFEIIKNIFEPLIKHDKAYVPNAPLGTVSFKTVDYDNAADNLSSKTKAIYDALILNKNRTVDVQEEIIKQLKRELANEKISISSNSINKLLKEIDIQEKVVERKTKRISYLEKDYQKAIEPNFNLASTIKMASEKNRTAFIENALTERLLSEESATYFSLNPENYFNDIDDKISEKSKKANLITSTAWVYDSFKNSYSKNEDDIRYINAINRLSNGAGKDKFTFELVNIETDDAKLATLSKDLQWLANSPAYNHGGAIPNTTKKAFEKSNKSKGITAFLTQKDADGKLYRVLSKTEQGKTYIDLVEIVNGRVDENTWNTAIANNYLPVITNVTKDVKFGYNTIQTMLSERETSYVESKKSDDSIKAYSYLLKDDAPDEYFEIYGTNAEGQNYIREWLRENETVRKTNNKGFPIVNQITINGEIIGMTDSISYSPLLVYNMLENFDDLTNQANKLGKNVSDNFNLENELKKLIEVLTSKSKKDNFSINQVLSLKPEDNVHPSVKMWFEKLALIQKFKKANGTIVLSKDDTATLFVNRMLDSLKFVTGTSTMAFKTVDAFRDGINKQLIDGKKAFVSAGFRSKQVAPTRKPRVNGKRDISKLQSKDDKYNNVVSDITIDDTTGRVLVKVSSFTQGDNIPVSTIENIDAYMPTMSFDDQMVAISLLATSTGFSKGEESSRKATYRIKGSAQTKEIVVVSIKQGEGLLKSFLNINKAKEDKNGKPVFIRKVTMYYENGTLNFANKNGKHSYFPKTTLEKIAEIIKTAYSTNAFKALATDDERRNYLIEQSKLSLSNGKPYMDEAIEGFFDYFENKRLNVNRNSLAGGTDNDYYHPILENGEIVLQEYKAKNNKNGYNAYLSSQLESDALIVSQNSAFTSGSLTNYMIVGDHVSDEPYTKEMEYGVRNEKAEREKIEREEKLKREEEERIQKEKDAELKRQADEAAKAKQNAAKQPENQPVDDTNINTNVQEDSLQDKTVAFAKSLKATIDAFESSKITFETLPVFDEEKTNDELVEAIEKTEKEIAKLLAFASDNKTNDPVLTLLKQSIESFDLSNFLATHLEKDENGNLLNTFSNNKNLDFNVFLRPEFFIYNGLTFSSEPLVYINSVATPSTTIENAATAINNSFKKVRESVETKLAEVENDISKLSENSDVKEVKKLADLKAELEKQQNALDVIDNLPDYLKFYIARLGFEGVEKDRLKSYSFLFVDAISTLVDSKDMQIDSAKDQSFLLNKFLGKDGFLGIDVPNSYRKLLNLLNKQFGNSVSISLSDINGAASFNTRKDELVIQYTSDLLNKSKYNAKKVVPTLIHEFVHALTSEKAFDIVNGDKDKAQLIKFQNDIREINKTFINHFKDVTKFEMNSDLMLSYNGSEITHPLVFLSILLGSTGLKFDMTAYNKLSNKNDVLAFIKEVVTTLQNDVVSTERFGVSGQEKGKVPKSILELVEKQSDWVTVKQGDNQANNDEIIAYTFNRPEFAKFLNTIDVTDNKGFTFRSLFNKLMQTITNYINEFINGTVDEKKLLYKVISIVQERINNDNSVISENENKVKPEIIVTPNDKIVVEDSSIPYEEIRELLDKVAFEPTAYRNAYDLQKSQDKEYILKIFSQSKELYEMLKTIPTLTRKAKADKIKDFEELLKKITPNSAESLDSLDNYFDEDIEFNENNSLLSNNPFVQSMLNQNSLSPIVEIKTAGGVVKFSGTEYAMLIQGINSMIYQDLIHSNERINAYDTYSDDESVIPGELARTKSAMPSLKKFFTKLDTNGDVTAIETKRRVRVLDELSKSITAGKTVEFTNSNGETSQVLLKDLLVDVERNAVFINNLLSNQKEEFKLMYDIDINERDENEHSSKEGNVMGDNFNPVRDISKQVRMLIESLQEIDVVFENFNNDDAIYGDEQKSASIGKFQIVKLKNGLGLPKLAHFSRLFSKLNSQLNELDYTESDVFFNKIKELVDNELLKKRNGFIVDTELLALFPLVYTTFEFSGEKEFVETKLPILRLVDEGATYTKDQELNFKLNVEFAQTFAKFRPDHALTRYANGEITSIAADQDETISVIIENWSQNLQDIIDKKIIDGEGTYSRILENMSIDFENQLQTLFGDGKGFGIEMIDSRKKAHLDKSIREAEKIFNAIGIRFSDVTKVDNILKTLLINEKNNAGFTAIKGLDDSSASGLKALLFQIYTSLEKNYKLDNPLTFSVDMLLVKSSIGNDDNTKTENLLKMLSNFLSQTEKSLGLSGGTSTITNADGNQQSVISLPNYALKIANALNKAVDKGVTATVNKSFAIRTAIQEKLPTIQNVFNNNSVILKKIAEGNKVKIGMANGVTSENIKATVSKQHYNDKFLTDFHGLSAASGQTFPFGRSADRTSEMTWQIVDNTGKPLELISQSLDGISNIIKGYLIDEVAAILKYRKAMIDGDAANYLSTIKFYGNVDDKGRIGTFKDFKGKGSQWRLFSKGNSNGSNYRDLIGENTLNAIEIAIDAAINNPKDIVDIANEIVNTNVIGEINKSFFVKQAEAKFKSLVNAKLITKKPINDKQSGTVSTSYDVSGIFPASMITSDNRFLAEKIVVEKLTHYYASSLVGFAEQFKLFACDPAFFKNEDDAIKRLKVFDSTKKAIIINEKYLNILSDNNTIMLTVESQNEPIVVSYTEDLFKKIVDSNYNPVIVSQLIGLPVTGINFGMGFRPDTIYKGYNADGDFINKPVNPWNKNFNNVILADVKTFSGDLIDGSVKFNKSDISNMRIEKEGENYNIVIPRNGVDVVYRNRNVEFGDLVNNFLDGFISDGITDEIQLTKKLVSYLNPYIEITEADGEGYVTLPMYKAICILSGLNWTSQMGLVYDNLIKGEHVSFEEYENFIKTTNMDFSAGFNKLKTQYVGPNTGEVDLNNGKREFNKRENVQVVTVYKHSLTPLIPSFIKGTNLEKLNKFLINTGHQLAQFESAQKFGGITGKDGKFNQPYTASQIDDTMTFESSVTNSEAIINGKPVVTQTNPLVYFGVQVEMGTSFKGKVTAGTQPRKLMLSNLMENGIPIDVENVVDFKLSNETAKKVMSPLYKLISEYNQLQNTIYKNAFDKMKKEFRIVEKAKGRLIIEDREAFLKALLSSMNGQRYTMNSRIAALGLVDKGTYLEMVANSDEVESILYAMFNTRIIKEKRNGEGAPQISSVGFEVKPRSKGTSTYLRTYELIYDDVTHKPIRIAPAECIISLPEGLIQYVDNKYKGLSINPLDAFNNDIEKLHKKMARLKWDRKHPDLSKDEQSLLKVISLFGFRIPNQGVNSCDSMVVKKFSPNNSGNHIVVPANMTAKAGSDFDIDKLTLYSTNFEIVNNELVVVDYKKDASVDELEKSSKEALQNYMLDLHIEIMEKPASYRYIMSPISTAMFEDEEIGVVGDIKFMLAKGNLKKHVDAYNKDIANNPSLTKNEINDLYYKYRSAFFVDYKKELAGKPLSNLYNPDIHLEKFAAFLSGKQGVGIAALNNTHHILCQLANVGFNYDHNYWMFPHNTVNGKGSFAGRTDADGHIISETISGFINAYVDVAKEPFVFNINAGLYTEGTMFYMLRAGAPLTWVIRFLNQPYLREFVERIELSKSMMQTEKNYGSKKEHDIFIEMYLEKYGFDSLDDAKKVAKINELLYSKLFMNLIQSKDYKLEEEAVMSIANELKVAESTKMYDINTSGRHTRYATSWEEKRRLFGENGISYIKLGTFMSTEMTKELQFHLLDLFLEYKRQGDSFSKMMVATTPETKGLGKSQSENEEKVDNYEKVKNLNMFSNWENILNETVTPIAYAHKVVKDGHSAVENMSIVGQNTVLKGIVRSVVEQLNEDFYPKPDARKKLKIRMQATRDLVTYAVQNYGEEFTIGNNITVNLNPNDVFKNLFVPDNQQSLPKRLNSLKITDRYKDNMFIKNINVIFAPEDMRLKDADSFAIGNEVRKRSNNYEIDYIKLKKELRSPEKDAITIGLAMLKYSENQSDRELYADIIAYAITQSGFSGKRFSILSVIPAEDIKIIKTKALERLNLFLGSQDSTDTNELFQNSFYERFVLNKPFSMTVQGNTIYTENGNAIERNSNYNDNEFSDGDEEFDPVIDDAPDRKIKLAMTVEKTIDNTDKKRTTIVKSADSIDKYVKGKLKTHSRVDNELRPNTPMGLDEVYNNFYDASISSLLVTYDENIVSVIDNLVANDLNCLGD